MAKSVDPGTPDDIPGRGPRRRAGKLPQEGSALRRRDTVTPDIRRGDLLPKGPGFALRAGPIEGENPVLPRRRPAALPELRRGAPLPGDSGVRSPRAGKLIAGKDDDNAKS